MARRAKTHAAIGLIVMTLLSGGVMFNMLALQTPDDLQRRAGRDAQAVAMRALAESARRGTGEPVRVVGTADGRAVVVEAGAAGSRIVRAGEPDATSSETIRAVQRELQARGYEPGASDGVAGLMTRAAVLAFEHDRGRPYTAEPSDELLRAIVLGESGPARAERGVAPDKRAQVEQVVRTIQQSLSAMGYATGRADGRLTPETQRAIREFETDQGLTVTGRISGPLVARLAKLAASGRVAAGRP